ncbi:type III PLP-dependent enzyme domain-containing protein [Marinagarivorans algicola]|uniref:hypothetical protein n=1 Tax=Marinagarivorans algicola TaxID=1513270 RepID=UPI0037357760
MTISTPYYLIDQKRMLPAIEIMRYIREYSGAKSVLALKYFSSWCTFDFMSQYMDGTTSSSLYEARLGFENFGGENHGYSVAYDDEIKEITQYCDKIIFNSISQLSRFKNLTKNISLGLRLNPEVDHSFYSLSDIISRYSRLGVRANKFSDKYAVKIYLDPGETAVKNSTSLIVKILDVIENELLTLIVDAGVETHALDALIYQFSPKLEGAEVIDEVDITRMLFEGKTVYRVFGRTCFSGIFLMV